MKTWFQIGLVSLMGVLMLSSSAGAQVVSPFANRGVREDQGSAPNWFGSLGTTTTAEKSETTGWFGQGILRSARPGEVENRPGMFSSLFQRSSDQPSLMQRANDRSRELVERTRNWAAEKNEAIKTRTSETWDTLTQGIRPTWEKENKKESLPAPLDGSNRVADTENEKTEKF
jgi:hypothetical protein